MTHARTKVRAAVKTDSAHFLTVDLGCQFALLAPISFQRTTAAEKNFRDSDEQQPFRDLLTVPHA
jgi:hypothetical protein